MNFDLQYIFERWESLSEEAQELAFPKDDGKLRFGKKQLMRINHKAFDRRLNWPYVMHVLADTGWYVLRLVNGDSLDKWDIDNIQLYAAFLGRYIVIARNGHLRAFLDDWQSLLEIIASYARSTFE